MVYHLKWRPPGRRTTLFSLSDSLVVHHTLTYLLSRFTVAIPQNQVELVTKKLVTQRLMFGLRLHEAPYMGDIF